MARNPSAARQPALSDVAALAGVSHMTVSRVINGGSVGRDTRHRVLAAIDELGYRPNPAARALATRRSRTLGVVGLVSVRYGPASTRVGVGEPGRACGYRISVGGGGCRGPDPVA